MIQESDRQKREQHALQRVRLVSLNDNPTAVSDLYDAVRCLAERLENHMRKENEAKNP